MNLKSLKEKTVVDYEIDKKKLEHFYGIKTTKQYPYTIIEKKILFSKEASIHSIDKRKQYSNYATFRDLTTSEYDKEEMKKEIVSGISLMKYSQSLRKELLTTLNIQKLLNSANTSSEHDTIQQSSGNSKLIERKWKKAINTVRITDELLKKCRLLKIKSQQEDIEPHKTEFKLYCKLENQSYESSINHFSKLNLQFYNQKEKLLRAYNREKVLIDYIKHCKEDILKTSVEDINQEIKDQFSREIIYSIYHPRETGFYFKYDSFMENYNITPAKVKKNERDLYDHIYAILSKCNYVNFLSFLYSKNSLFKFIYDEFSDKDAAGDYSNIYDQIEESYQQDKDKEKKKGKQTPQHSDNLNLKDIQMIFNDKNNRSSSSSTLLNDMIGSDICLRIGIVPDPINEEALDKSNNKIAENNRNDVFINKINQCQSLDFNYLIIIKNGFIKIFSPKFDESQDALNENIIINKINPKTVFNIEIEAIETTIIKINNEDIPDEELMSFDNQVFYLIKEITDEINYYLFKIKLEYKKSFETVIDRLRIKKAALKDLNKSMSDDGGVIEFAEIQNQLKNLKNIKHTEESAKEDSFENQNHIFDLKDKLFPPKSNKGKDKTGKQSLSPSESPSKRNSNEIKSIDIESASEK